MYLIITTHITYIYSLIYIVQIITLFNLYNIKRIKVQRKKRKCILNSELFDPGLVPEFKSTYLENYMMKSSPNQERDREMLRKFLGIWITVFCQGSELRYSVRDPSITQEGVTSPSRKRWPSLSSCQGQCFIEICRANLQGKHDKKLSIRM